MTMEVTSDSHQHSHYHHKSQATTAAVSNAMSNNFLASQLYNTGFSYELGGNDHLHSSVSVMSLKSDESLCIMEAISRSQSQEMIPSLSPKLEDFLGGATHGGREATDLSLDSIYYNQNAEPDSEREHSLGLFKQQEQHILLQSQRYYSGVPCNGMYQFPFEEVTRESRMQNYCSEIRQAMEQRMDGSFGGINCRELQPLSLSMSPGSQSSCVSAPSQISQAGPECATVETQKRGLAKLGQKQPVHRKSIDTFGQRTSQYRGVTRHRWTGRYEAHLWDNSCKKEGQTRKGRQVYLGGYDLEEKAARAYDLAALKYWGPSTHLNFPLKDYHVEIEEMKNMSRQEYVAHIRRKSSGFSRGASMYRGVTRHHQHGRWQARIGRVAGNKDLYLGTFGTQEEAAEAYDIAAIKFRGVNAVTNFVTSRYDVERIMASSCLLSGELARRNKEIKATNAIDNKQPMQNITEMDPPEISNGNNLDWRTAFHDSLPLQPNASVDTVDRKSMNSGGYLIAPSPVALPHLMGIESVSCNQPAVNDSTEFKAHFSNASSVVSSLSSSSREASPDKSNASSTLFAKAPLASKLIVPTSDDGIWLPLTQMGPPISLAQLPVSAVWNSDA